MINQGKSVFVKGPINKGRKRKKEKKEKGEKGKFAKLAKIQKSGQNSENSENSESRLLSGFASRRCNNNFFVPEFHNERYNRTSKHLNV